MPYKVKLSCLLCNEDLFFREEEVPQVCDLCGAAFETDAACSNGHAVCPMCRQQAARESIIAHCLKSDHLQPYPLMLELMQLPKVAMHGPEHHLLLTAALLTAYCNEQGKREALSDHLTEANERSLEVPGGACGF